MRSRISGNVVVGVVCGASGGVFRVKIELSLQWRHYGTATNGIRRSEGEQPDDEEYDGG